MAKRRYNAEDLLAAGEGAHLTDEFLTIDKSNKVDGDKFELLNVEEIEDNPLQPRKTISQDELQELASNIELHGLIQPITVIRVSDQKLILLAGQRRLLAHKLLKKEKIKAIVREDERFESLAELDWLNDTSIAKVLFEISVSENELRESLTSLELALSIDEVLKKGAYKTINEVAQVLGKSKTYLSKIYSMLRLDETILEDLQKTRGVEHIEALYELQKVSDKKLQVDLYFKLKKGEINIDNIRVHSVKRRKETQKAYDFKVSKSSVSLKINTRDLPEETKEKMNEELQAIVDKYTKMEG